MVAKRARVFFPEASDAEIQKQIALNPLGYARDALLFSTQEAAHQDVHILVAEVQSRAQDVEMLSASISEVQDMFRDFTVLIADQHEDIDTISDTVRGHPWGAGDAFVMGLCPLYVGLRAFAYKLHTGQIT